jgi:hypothetical protein
MNITVSPKPKTAGSNSVVPAIAGSVLRILLLIKFLRNSFVLLGEISDFVNWLESNDRKKIRNRRESVWNDISIALGGRQVRGVEFGVAWGYLTWYWLTKISTSIIAWDGFDRFTGLPRAWRGLPIGAFDAHGNPPDIDDSRITWHVGDIESTINKLNLTREKQCAFVFFFDLDIYEPSKIAFDHIKDVLQPGDILYFDEAFDADERKLLDETILQSGTFRIVSASWLTLAIEVVAMH